ncbi:hypothetical protein RHMOL_Rhmol07G0185300 [Rhododendron molle]|uniref:Uncharacterized protein n=1 Tax=Rhododendron molle TaxID=49168 RepID=A0ACC0N1X2_RHOML|nr:hypothetical protein RHMOL_Rhmol07G0185300 [Rhododendron molle]
MANGNRPWFHLEHLERQVLRIPSRSIRVTHRHCFRFRPVNTVQRNHICLCGARLVAIKHRVCIILLVAHHKVVKSIIDSNEVAQYFSSPLIPGSSHSLMVFFIIFWKSKKKKN